MVHDVVGAERERVSHEATDGEPDRRHRVGVDDEVVAPVEDPVDEALRELDRELARELRRVVVVVEEGDVEVGRHHVPVRPRSRLAGLVAIERRHERSPGGHRGQAWHAVVARGIRHEVLHEGADAAHDPADDRRERSAAGHERQAGSGHHDEVRVEVHEIVPAIGVGEVGAAVGGGHEDDRVDGRPQA